MKLEKINEQAQSNIKQYTIFPFLPVEIIQNIIGLAIAPNPPRLPFRPFPECSYKPCCEFVLRVYCTDVYGLKDEFLDKVWFLVFNDVFWKQLLWRDYKKFLPNASEKDLLQDHSFSQSEYRQLSLEKKRSQSGIWRNKYLSLVFLSSLVANLSTPFGDIVRKVKEIDNKKYFVCAFEANFSLIEWASQFVYRFSHLLERHPEPFKIIFSHVNPSRISMPIYSDFQVSRVTLLFWVAMKIKSYSNEKVYEQYNTVFPAFSKIKPTHLEGREFWFLLRLLLQFGADINLLKDRTTLSGYVKELEDKPDVLMYLEWWDISSLESKFSDKAIKLLEHIILKSDDLAMARQDESSVAKFISLFFKKLSSKTDLFFKKIKELKDSCDSDQFRGELLNLIYSTAQQTGDKNMRFLLNGAAEFLNELDNGVIRDNSDNSSNNSNTILSSNDKVWVVKKI